MDNENYINCLNKKNLYGFGLKYNLRKENFTI